MYLESMAIVPQLFMFQKQAKGIVEVLVSSRVRATPPPPHTHQLAPVFLVREGRVSSGISATGMHVYGESLPLVLYLRLTLLASWLVAGSCVCFT